MQLLLLLLLLLLPFQWCLFVCPFATPPNAQLKHNTQERTRLRVVCILLARFASRRRCCCAANAAAAAAVCFYFVFVCRSPPCAQERTCRKLFVVSYLGARNCVLLLFKLISFFFYLFIFENNVLLGDKFLSD